MFENIGRWTRLNIMWIPAFLLAIGSGNITQPRVVANVEIQFETIKVELPATPKLVESSAVVFPPHPTDSLQCLADNIYYESGFEPEEGKIAVAQVTVNRMNEPGYPKTVCDVVYFKKVNPNTGKKEAAFSWTLGSKWRAHGMNYAAYWDCLEIAREILSNKIHSTIIGSDVLFYHATYIQPSWANSRDRHRVARIGQHIFYAKAS